jgi:hypothetical protein
MDSPILGLRVAGVIFALLFLGQLARLVLQPQIVVAGYEMPLWPSVLALLVLAGLSFWMWKLARTLVKGGRSR